MASERAARRRRRRPAVRRAWLYCLLLTLPALTLAAVFLYQKDISLAPALLLIGCLLLYLLIVAAALIEGLIRPLQTLSNVVSSLREGDYSFRARGAGTVDAFGELAGEVNALADLLQKQRVRSLEATALLARILEVMHAPLFAFDRENLLQLVRTPAVSDTLPVSWASKISLPRQIRASIPSEQNRRAGCCAKLCFARMAYPIRCCFWPT
jgi:HAMP domain-containing protein